MDFETVTKMQQGSVCSEQKLHLLYPDSPGNKHAIQPCSVNPPISLLNSSHQVPHTVRESTSELIFISSITQFYIIK